MRKIAGLRRPLRSKGQGRISSIESRQAPVKGWNARDPIAAMKPGDAIILDDMFPMPNDIMLRKGIVAHVTGIGDQVESLMPYNNPDGTQTLFCAAGNEFYDVTSAGAVGSAVVSTLTNARWQHNNFTNSSGDSYLCCFNGVDNPRYWNGTSWIEITGVSTPAITGLTPSDIVSSTTHMRRMWLVQKDTLKAWYLPVDAVGGAAAALDLSGIAKRGGYLMAIESWTIDSGAGLDDHWIAITSEGEIIVYAGSDPSSANTWAIKGVWYIGSPIGRRCLIKFGGDILMILKNGVFPLSKALLSASVDRTVAMTDKIDQAMNAAASSHSSNFGWQLTSYTAENMLLLNVPITEGSSQHQYVMNTLTGAWCRFTGYEANCFEVFGDELYCGGNGVVSKAWSTFSDNGAGITGIGETAFDYFSAKTKKSFKMVRPILSTNGTPAVSIGIDIDYEDADRLTTNTFTGIMAGLWGIALWGIGLWGSGLQTIRNWIGVSEIGLCAATHIHIQAEGLEVHWQATDFLYEVGDGIV